MKRPSQENDDINGQNALKKSIVISIDSKASKLEPSPTNSDDDVLESIRFLRAPTHKARSLHQLAMMERNDRDDRKLLTNALEFPERQLVDLTVPVEINITRSTDEPSVYLPAFLANTLKEHQIQGVRFMWRNLVQEQAGAVLAHAMGLGKTLQVISFVYCLLNNHELVKPESRLSKGLSMSVLILCPPIVIDNWENEFYKWIPPAHHIPTIYKLKRAANWDAKMQLLKQWSSQGGILLCGYQMYRDLVFNEAVEDVPNQVDKQTQVRERLKAAQLLLCDPGPDLVVCDEAHIIKNEESSLNRSVTKINTPHRLCLTGYPLQNNLKEYWCMIGFCRPKFLPDWLHFRQRFVSWIVRGLYKDASKADRAYAKQKMYVLTVWLEPIVYRVDANVLLKTLPSKQEYHIECRLSALQHQLYKRFLKAGLPAAVKTLFAKTTVLTRLCNHPGTLSIAKQHRDYDEDLLIDQDDEILHDFKWAMPEVDDPATMDPRHSGKMMVALRLIELAKMNQEKVLLFSRSICTLDYIGAALEHYHIRYCRIDGTVQSGKRQTMIDSFTPGSDYDVFLLSSLAGSLGVNLTAASRVILFDVGWNPCHDEQAIGRAFRFGQTKPVSVYRLCTHETIERRLYNLNVFKVTLSSQAVDRKDMMKRIGKTDLKEYFKVPPEGPIFDGRLPGNTDQLLADLLLTHSRHICRIVDHQKALDDFSMLDLPKDQKEAAMKELDQVKRRQEFLKAGKPLPVDLRDEGTPFLDSLAEESCWFEIGDGDDDFYGEFSFGKPSLLQSIRSELTPRAAVPSEVADKHPIPYRGSGFESDPIILD